MHTNIVRIQRSTLTELHCFGSISAISYRIEIMVTRVTDIQCHELSIKGSRPRPKLGCSQDIRYLIWIYYITVASPGLITTVQISTARPHVDDVQLQIYQDLMIVHKTVNKLLAH